MGKQILKRVVAIILAFVLLPIADIANAKVAYCDEVIEEHKGEYENNEDFSDDKIDKSKNIVLTGCVNSDKSITLNWNKSDEKNHSYKINKNGEFIDTVNTTSYIDKDIQNGETYYYGIAEYNAETGLYVISNAFSLQVLDKLNMNHQNYVLDRDMFVNSIDFPSGFTLDLNGHTLTVYSDTDINGNLIINGGKLLCIKNLNFNENSILHMTNDNDNILCNGDFTVNNDWNPTYSFSESVVNTGIIDVKGNVSIANGDFTFTDKNVFRLSGNNKQSLNYVNCIPQLNILDIKNTSEAGVEYSKLLANELINDNNCKMTLVNSTLDFREGWTLEQDEVIDGDLNIISGELNLNGHTLTVNGTLTQFGGDIVINHGKLVVTGTYYFGDEFNDIKSTGRLLMNYNDDTVQATYIFLFAFDKSILNSGSLSTDWMRVKGNFSINNNLDAKSFSNSYGNIYIGGTVKTDQFYYYEYSGIIMNRGKLYITEFGPGGQIGTTYGLGMSHPEDYVYIENGMYYYDIGDNPQKNTITDGIIESKGNCKGLRMYENSKLILSGTDYQEIYDCTSIPSLINNNTSDMGISIGYNCSVDNIQQNIETARIDGNKLLEGFKLEEDTVLDGNYGLISGTIDLNGYTLTINGNLCQYGGNIVINEGTLLVNGNYQIKKSTTQNNPLLSISKVKDTMKVNGNFDFISGDSELNTGVLEILGDIRVSDGFKSLADNRVILSGDKAQHIYVNEDADIIFITIKIKNYSDEDVFFQNSVYKSQLITNNCRVHYMSGSGEIGWTLNKDTTQTGDLTIVDGELNLNGHTLHVEGNLFQNGGTVNINNGTLIVDCNYQINNTSSLNMSQTNDNLIINKNFTLNTNKYTKLIFCKGSVKLNGDLNCINIGEIVTDKECNFQFCGTNNKQIYSNGKNYGKPCLKLPSIELLNNSIDAIDIKDNLICVCTGNLETHHMIFLVYYV